ncbi:MAG: flagellar basal body rod protein FlgC [Pseudomonadota bacterium]
MALSRIFDISGSGMNAQALRLNVTASNLANAGNVAGSADAVYRARVPVFAAHHADALQAGNGTAVRVTAIEESDAPVRALYQPDHPDADADGNVFATNVNAVEEMVNMLSASRAYQSNIEVMKTSKELLLQTLSLGN